MGTAQLPVTLGYVTIVLIALLTPYLTWGKARAAAADRWMIGSILGGAALLTAARYGAFQILSLVLLLPLLRLGVRAVLGGIAAILLFAPVIWWGHDASTTAFSAALFLLLGLGTVYIARAGAATVASKAPPGLFRAMTVAALVGIAVGLLTAPFGSWLALFFAWHHWSAYLSPVYAWLAGGVPYRDFPIQYGLGPTVLLATTCGPNCWAGIYWTTIVANALYFSILTGCVIILTSGAARGVRWLAIGALWCASFVWTAFPADFASAAMTPSVAGLRFLPTAALLLHILSAESSGRRRDWVGHAIWLCEMVWSTETAFFGTLIWWPYLAMRDAAEADTAAARWIALARGALRGVAAVAAAAVALTLVLWWLSSGAIRPSDYFAYVLHPPGPMPINPTGPLWLALACILVALHGLAGVGRLSRSRALYVSLLAFLAAGTYFLSRSADNNILNLFPWLVILLAATVQQDPSTDESRSFTRAFARTVFAAMIAFVGTVNFASWTDGGGTDGLLSFGPSRMIDRFTPVAGSRPQMLSNDALRAFAFLRERNAGAVVLLNGAKLIPAQAPGAGWTGVNNVANFESLPRPVVTRFICRGALAYKRPGWILVDEREYHPWVSAFEAAYEIREQVGFGPYRAYRLTPRATPLRCSNL